MTPEELAAIRERDAGETLADYLPESAWGDRRALLAHIDAITEERDQWRQSAEDAFARLRKVDL